MQRDGQHFENFSCEANLSGSKFGTQLCQKGKANVSHWAFASFSKADGTKFVHSRHVFHRLEASSSVAQKDAFMCSLYLVP